MVSSLELKGNWNTIKGLLKQKYAELTDNDLMFEQGKEDEFYGRLQKRTGETKENLKKFIDQVGE